MKDWKYILYVASAIGVFLLVKALAPKQFDWRVTFAHDDKNPYGAYTLYSLLPGFFNEQQVYLGEKTLYELRDTIGSANLVAVATSFSPGAEDVEVLLEHVSKGNVALISAEHFTGKFADTLGLSVSDYLFRFDDIDAADTAFLHLVSPTLDTTSRFKYRRGNVYSYFSNYDSLRTTVIARNDLGYPAAIRISWGKGSLILNCTPLAFSNIYLLHENNSEFASALLSYLPDQAVWWMEYYHLGRRVASSPLRFILSNEALKWAYYVTLAALVLFMLFEARRKQRIIPVIRPLENTSLMFVSTIGNLYFQRGDHKNIAEKRINFLMEHIRSRYRLKTTNIDDEFKAVLAAKSGRSPRVIEDLFGMVLIIQSSDTVTAKQLMLFDHYIDRFHSKENWTDSKEIKS